VNEIEMAEVSAGYGKVRVLDQLSLCVSSGEVVALLGANGAGKTTAIRVLSGEIPTMTGGATVLGRPVRAGRVSDLVRHGLGVVPSDHGIARNLTVRDNFRLRTGQSQRIDHVLETFPALAKLLQRKVSLLSGGERQMAALACALLLEPQALLIDEMSSGLAPSVVRGLLPAIREEADQRGVAVLLVEQSTDIALEVSDRLYVIRRGRCVLEAGTAEVRSNRDQLLAGYLGEMSPPNRTDPLPGTTDDSPLEEQSPG
jgi:branched-chain amino acid transport system ATP-binding protein